MSDFSEVMHDVGVCRALADYIRYGLHPGSFGEACLLGDYSLAYSRAHFHLKRPHDGEDVIANMIEWVKSFPSICHGSPEAVIDWMNHEGLSKAPTSNLVLVRLEWNEGTLGSFDLFMKSTK